jgi:hypothetical protein
MAKSRVIDDRGNRDKDKCTRSTSFSDNNRSSGKHTTNNTIAQHDVQVEAGNDGIECIKSSIHLHHHHLHLRRWWIIVWIVVLLLIIILSIVVTQIQQKQNGTSDNNIARDNEYLISHNKRRKEWHTKYNTTYIPLTWDNSLKYTARNWGKKLLSNCGKGICHDPDNIGYGENIAANIGSGNWGSMRTTEEVLHSFVEAEENLQPPENGHLTQVLWRSTKYEGCADVVKRMKKDTFCHIQVCRYARIGELDEVDETLNVTTFVRLANVIIVEAHLSNILHSVYYYFIRYQGNCGLKAYESDEPDWWLEPMLANDTRCGPECPPSGCH